MPDIVEELKMAAIDHDSTGYVMMKAVEEIKRLRFELQAAKNEIAIADEVIERRNAK